MRSKWKAYVAISLASFTLSGCAAPLIAGLTIAEISAGATITSIVFTGKGTGDHLMDVAMGKDCRILEGIVREGRDICVEAGSEATNTDFKGIIPVQLAITGTSPPHFNDDEAPTRARPVLMAAQLDPAAVADHEDDIVQVLPQVTEPASNRSPLARSTADKPPTSIGTVSLDGAFVPPAPTVEPTPKIEQQQVYFSPTIPVRRPALFDGPLPVARPAAGAQADGLPLPVERPARQVAMR